MAKIKYLEIYNDLKNKIDSKVYTFQQLLPSENTLVKHYDCSRNTVRRAIANLVSDGYVQTIHGQGVRVIYQELKQKEYLFGGIETFKESSIRNKNKYRTEVVFFTELTVDEEIEQLTSFPISTEIYYLQRVRYLDEKPLIIDYNYFRKDIVKDLTKEIAEDSIYEYMENELKENIITTKRMMTVEKINELDQTYLNLQDYNCVAIVTNFTFNADGVMFEFTQSRHTPDSFVFFEQAQRIK
ncbi:GntR family transcriptional regulator [Aeromicrobium ponti]|uniref:Trehalose operon repressor n=1 Tax=Cytobacillus oceanisediminis TaxID=665099 RepID=A0A562K2H9_9BACI|nr:trehalose operon repressor [Cytobacillus oceanisediminis]TWH89641.1 GntR family trehalose operon transcriptional repressor [Cytobacillus oceanisediminis]